MTATQGSTIRSDLRAGGTPDLSGRWRSQSGSEMVLKISEGQVRGSYRSALGTVSPIDDFPLVGWASADLLSFTVSFGARGVAAWVAQHIDSAAGGRITALWHLVEDIPEDQEPAWLWYGFKTGADTFSRVES